MKNKDLQWLQCSKDSQKTGKNLSKMSWENAVFLKASKSLRFMMRTAGLRWPKYLLLSVQLANWTF